MWNWSESLRARGGGHHAGRGRRQARPWPVCRMGLMDGSNARGAVKNPEGSPPWLPGERMRHGPEVVVALESSGTYATPCARPWPTLRLPSSGSVTRRRMTMRRSSTGLPSQHDGKRRGGGRELAAWGRPNRGPTSRRVPGAGIDLLGWRGW